MAMKISAGRLTLKTIREAMEMKRSSIQPPRRMRMPAKTRAKTGRVILSVCRKISVICMWWPERRVAQVMKKPDYKWPMATTLARNYHVDQTVVDGGQQRVFECRILTDELLGL